MGYVEQTTRSGLCVIASDHSSNLSYLSGCDSGEPIGQKYAHRELVADGTKHYVALIVSDGDNLQWCQNLPFTDHYKDRQNSTADYKLTWTAPPVMATLAPEALNISTTTQTQTTLSSAECRAWATSTRRHSPAVCFRRLPG